MNIYICRGHQFSHGVNTIINLMLYGDMSELADEAVSKTVAEMREGSSPSIPTSEATRK